MLPDGTFPNSKLVLGVLNCADGLAIESDHLNGNKLGKYVRMYAEGIANQP